MKFDKKIWKNKGFTIVELIISVMILIILITISTISYSRYTSIARDGSRMADVNNISKSFEKNSRYTMVTFMSARYGMESVRILRRSV